MLKSEATPFVHGASTRTYELEEPSKGTIKVFGINEHRGEIVLFLIKGITFDKLSLTTEKGRVEVFQLRSEEVLLAGMSKEVVWVRGEKVITDEFENRSTFSILALFASF